MSGALAARARTLLVAIAGIALAKAVVDAWAPDQSTDFVVVRHWVRLVLADGRSPFNASDGANYPPFALVLLAPIALGSTRVATIVWSIVNAAAAPAVATLGVRALRPDLRRDGAALVVVLFLLWGGLLLGIKDGQFTLLVVGAGLAAVRLADTHPAAAGACLAMSLIKPHVGTAFVLWAILTRRWRPAAVAATAVAAAWVAFSILVRQTPWEVGRAYGAALWAYSGPVFHSGDIEVRPLVHAAIPWFAAAEAVHLVAVAGALAAVCALGWHGHRRVLREADIVALCASWLLVSVFHNAYDWVLALPIVAALWPSAGRSGRRDWIAVAGGIEALLIVDPATVWWRLQRFHGVRGPVVLAAVMPALDRVAALAMFVYVLIRARQMREEGSARFIAVGE